MSCFERVLPWSRNTQHGARSLLIKLPVEQVLEFGGRLRGVLAVDFQTQRAAGAGGRYDDLMGRFGRPMPAVGVALDLDTIAEVVV